MRHRPFVAALALLFTTAGHTEPVHYDESVDGDIPFESGVGWALTVTVAPGQNTVTGILTHTPEFSDNDGFQFIVPEGMQVESIHFEYAATYQTDPGVAGYTWYLDGVEYDTTLPPSERVDIVAVQSDSRFMYPDEMPLGAGEYRLGRGGSGITTDFVYEVAYTWTITVSGGEPEPIEVSVPYQRIGPRLDGEIADNEWRTAPQIQLDNGSVSVVHDETRLYFLFNMRQDRSDNAFRDGGPDQVWLLADVNEDGAITPNVDRRYRMLSGTGNFRYELYAAPGGPPLQPPVDRSFSALAEGFGCFFADNSARILPLSCDRHRVWEVAIDLLELQAADDKSARVGFLVQSELAEFETLPDDLTDFTQFARFTLEGDTSMQTNLTAGTEPLEVLEVRVTQGIQDATNSLDLVTSRDTWLEARFGGNNSRPEYPTVTIFAQQDGVDVPGSPWTRFSSMRWQDGRDPAFEGFFRVQVDGIHARGEMDVDIVSRQARIFTTTAGTGHRARFVPTITPTYWIVPVDTGTSEAALPRDQFLDRQELETRSVLPVADIDFVRRPVIKRNPATKADANAMVNEYIQTATLAWTLGLLFTGESPFDLPDQTIGAFASSKNFGTTIGRSDPRWLDGAAVGVWIKDSGIANGQLLAHELNHNFDLDTSGNWGRHITGCTAVGVDPQWPYVTSDIQEPGLLTEPVLDKNGSTIMPPRAVVPQMFDYMSYCRWVYDTDISDNRAYPYQWVSPYRWQVQLDNLFRATRAASPLTALAAVSPAAVTPVQDSLYVSGRIGIDGTGSLDPVLRQPGIAGSNYRPGEYEVRVIECGGATVGGTSLGASFVDAEDEPRDQVAFAMTLVDPGNVCAVQLLHGQSLLAEQSATPNSPEVEMLFPNGGERLVGVEKIAWRATDADGDELTAALFHSPDGGMTWLPIASGIVGGEFDVDTATLPGSETGRMRVVVTDGMNTVSDDSDADYSVAPKPPSVSILGPGADNELFAGEAQRYEGKVLDPQGNVLSLPEESYVWLLDGNAVGRGDVLNVHLVPDAEELVLRVTDDRGLTGEAALSLNVSDYDADRDGVPDTHDACPLSDTTSRLTIAECDPGVEIENDVMPDGCTIGYAIEQALESTGARGARDVIRTLRAEGYLGNREFPYLMRCLTP